MSRQKCPTTSLPLTVTYISKYVLQYSRQVGVPLKLPRRTPLSIVTFLSEASRLRRSSRARVHENTVAPCHGSLVCRISALDRSRREGKKRRHGRCIADNKRQKEREKGRVAVRNGERVPLFRRARVTLVLEGSYRQNGVSNDQCR